MDPDKTLKRLREVVQIGKSTFDLTPEETKVDDLIELFCKAQETIELFEALDGWLSKGGFLPKDWSRPTKDLLFEVLPCACRSQRCLTTRTRNAPGLESSTWRSEVLAAWPATTSSRPRLDRQPSTPRAQPPQQ